MLYDIIFCGDFYRFSIYRQRILTYGHAIEYYYTTLVKRYDKPHSYIVFKILIVNKISLGKYFEFTTLFFFRENNYRMFIQLSTIY